MTYEMDKNSLFTPEKMMRFSLQLFVCDPPDSDFQEGYLCALMVFATEALNFRSDDPDIQACKKLVSRLSVAAEARSRFSVLDGGKSD